MYQLPPTSQIKWTTTQEGVISREYPFQDLHNESADQYIVRTYLQFLWLPEVGLYPLLVAAILILSFLQSVMPLRLFVPSILRAKVASTSELNPATPHPLHALVDQVLLSVRAASTKYKLELPQILLDGGGAGEIEETMMWYAVTHEKAENGASMAANADGLETWANESWRLRWMDRIEEREYVYTNLFDDIIAELQFRIQIQILLHLIKLSLRGPSPPETSTTPLKKRKRTKATGPPVASLKDRLQTFMDKAATRQLLAQTSGTQDPDKNDGIQIFCAEVVEPACVSHEVAFNDIN